jgi:hypothetical protein
MPSPLFFAVSLGTANFKMRALPKEWRRKRMNTQLLLEEKRNILENRLLSNMKRKRVLELEITRQCEQLKRIEISMEKNSHVRTLEKTGISLKDE